MTTIVCCICVICTAAISSYGMPASRSADDDSYYCTPFFLLFTSSCILVSSAYYMAIKISILAMRALVSGSQGKRRFQRVSTESYLHSIKGNPRKEAAGSRIIMPRNNLKIEKEEQADARVSVSHTKEQQDNHQANNSDLSSSPWSFSEGDIEEGTNAAAAEDTVHSANMSISVSSPSSNSSSMHDDTSSHESDFMGCMDTASLSESSASSQDEENNTTKRRAKKRNASSSPRHHHSSQRNERFTFCKVWTNVYGLSIGIFCIVYSLLLPNELSSFVFCTCLWVAGIYECISKYDGTWFFSGKNVRRTGKRGSCCTIIRSFICGSPNTEKKRQIVAELQNLSISGRTISSSSSRVLSEKSRHESASSTLVGLCILLMVGISLKAAGASISGRLWQDGWSASTAAFNILIPMVGVAAIKNMQKTREIRSTIELSVPICSMGSLVCLLCIVLIGRDAQGGGQWCSCMKGYFWES